MMTATSDQPYNTHGVIPGRALRPESGIPFGFFFSHNAKKRNAVRWGSIAVKCFLAGIIAVSALTACISPACAEGLASQVEKVDPPEQMPPMVFEDADGHQHSLSDYRGRFLLLNVWATWCPPCVAELPSLDALQAREGRHLAILPLSEDHSGSDVAAFYKLHQIAHLPVAVDRGGNTEHALDLDGLPTTLVVDRKGFLLARVEGSTDWASDAVATFLKAQMRE